MPDQSSAATEHAILSEITAPLATLPDDPVAVLNVDFPLALRGYDRLAVDAYVKQTSQLVAELQATRSPEAAVRRALERVGEQISGILQRAHEAAGQITSQSRSEAEDRLEQSRREATEITAQAEQRVRDLDTDTDRIWAERHRIVDDTRVLARQLLALADSAAERFPPAEDAVDQSPSLALYDAEAGAAGQLDPADEEAGAAVEDDVESAPADESGLADQETGSTLESDAESAAADQPDRAEQVNESTAAFPPVQPAVEADSEARSAAPLEHESDPVIRPASHAANRRSDR
jgi:cell division initiation protein